MTAEGAGMNQQGGALPAGSAVTVHGERGPKIFSSAAKIFSLSKHEPVAIMIYGAASLMQVPWETIIKTHRAELGETKCDHLEDYARNFIQFLEQDEVLFTAEQKD